MEMPPQNSQPYKCLESNFITPIWPDQTQARLLSVPVLVYVGCCNKIPLAGWLMNNRYLFLTVVDAGKSKVKVSAR